MNCERAIALLLEADLTELEGLGHTDLVAHLERCGRCKERARRIVAAERALGAALERVDLASGARGASAVGVAGTSGNRRTASVRSRRGWRALRPAWIPLALAAGIAALILIPDSPPEPVVTTSVALDDDAGRLRVDVPAGRNAVLYETDNPNVIVVWFY